MFTNQIGKLPQSSSRGNNYQTVIHKIDGNSTWVEPMKNRTEGEMILVWCHTLARMKLQGIIIMSKHRVLNNEISAAYKAETQATNIIYQRVPPDDHRRNICQKVHPNLERPFCRLHQWHRKRSHSVHVVPGNTASRMTTFTTTSVQHQPKEISVCPCVWLLDMENPGWRSHEWCAGTINDMTEY